MADWIPGSRAIRSFSRTLTKIDIELRAANDILRSADLTEDLLQVVRAAVDPLEQLAGRKSDEPVGWEGGPIDGAVLDADSPLPSAT
jgi:hypothetical protein